MILWDINEEKNKQTYDALRALGHRRIYLHKVDLSSEVEVRETAKLCKEKHGHISMIIQGASSTSFDLRSIFDKEASTELVKPFRLFYESSVWLYQEFLPKMIEKNCGHLVLLTTETAILSKPLADNGLSTFQNSQIKLAECVNAELKQSNRNNQICFSIVYLRNRVLKDSDAKKIVGSILKNKNYIYLPSYLNYVIMLRSILPTKCFDLFDSSAANLNTKKDD